MRLVAVVVIACAIGLIAAGGGGGGGHNSAMQSLIILSTSNPIRDIFSKNQQDNYNICICTQMRII
jgi:hypothetical protein